MNRTKISTFKLCQHLLWLGLLVCASAAVQAEQYMDKPSFLRSAFGEQTPKVSKLWLDAKDQKMAQEILGHQLRQLRLSYWHQNGRSAWILNEIGKVKPITIGIVVEEAKIAAVNILEFRESRGWEVKYPFFTEQFIGSTLAPNKHLDKNIDGITGATLSVRAVKNVARFALYLASKTDQDQRDYAQHQQTQQ